MPTFTTIYQRHQSYPFLPVLRESARYVFFKGIRSLSRRRTLFSQTISTPNGAVGSLVRFIFVLLPPPLGFFHPLSHLPISLGFFVGFYSPPPTSQFRPVFIRPTSHHPLVLVLFLSTLSLQTNNFLTYKRSRIYLSLPEPIAPYISAFLY